MKNTSSDANVISSNVVYKIKHNPQPCLSLKDRVVLHSNRGEDFFSVGHNSSYANMTVGSKDLFFSQTKLIFR